MRLATILAAGCLLLVAGCGGGHRGAPAPAAAEIPGTLGSVSAEFQPGGLADVIRVRTVDRLPMRSAALAGPGGEHIPAYSLDVEPSPVTGMSLGQRVLMGMPGSTRTEARVDTMVSTALIRLPDPAVYGRTWRDQRVLVRLGDPGGPGREMTLAAPAPPPSVPKIVPDMPSTEPTRLP